MKHSEEGPLESRSTKPATASLLFHPTVPIVLFLAAYVASLDKHPWGWVAIANTATRQVGTTSLYGAFIALGLALGGIAANVQQSRRHAIDAAPAPWQRTLLMAASATALALMVLRLAAIGELPLLSSDPAIRAQDRLGGFVDYPTRIISLLPLIWALHRRKTAGTYQRSLAFLAASAITLQVLFTNRQEIAFILVGVAYVHAMSVEDKHSVFDVARIPRRRRNSSIPSLALVGASFLVVAALMVVRFGDLGRTDDSPLDVAWIGVSGDISGAMKLGRFVLDHQAEPLGGRYQYGWISAVMGDDSPHGAELIRERYLPWSRTAQSIGLPYSYAVDHGSAGVALNGIFNGFVLAFLWTLLKYRRSPLLVLAYFLHFFNMLWAVRAGTPAVSGPVAYQLLAVTAIYGDMRRPTTAFLSPSAGALLMVSLALAMVFALIRF